MSRFTRRRLLTDAALALGLLALTLGPQLVTGALAEKKTAESLIPVSSGWWLFSGLILAGLLIRQHRPVPALVLVAAGAFGHLVMQTKLQLLDLALPLVLYTVAAAARRRRLALALLGLTLILTYFAMLAGRLGVQDQEKRAAAEKEGQTVEKQGQILDKQAQILDKQAQILAEQGQLPAGDKGSPPGVVITADVLADTGQAVLEVWLLSIAAFAVGDGMRSRRAHLAAVEQRTADLAREERQRAALAVAAERARITRELHDVVAHGISVMVVQAQGAAAALERHPDRSADALRHVIDTGRSSLAEMRRLLAAGRTDPVSLVAEPASPAAGLGSPPAGPGSPADGLGSPADGLGSPADGLGSPAAGSVSPAAGLSSPADGSVSPADGSVSSAAGPVAAAGVAGDARLAPLPGVGDVPALVDRLRSAGMRIELVIEGVPETVPAAVDLSAYRIVQEALTNTLKHAGAGAAARVLLEFRPDRIRVEVADDGVGLTGAADGRGNGLRGIAERVAMLGGALETGPRDAGTGFRVAATLPLAAVPAGS
ncbi:histidine kinase [Paractinoplanes rhizophilus]|uniref:histidine kinase n=1 Tax=Paractinoplanes rhizophilus TaxID=1416877 RepID=A0ABW2HJB2_9ACTN